MLSYQPRGVPGRRVHKGKKKPTERRPRAPRPLPPWDGTINDLKVHKRSKKDQEARHEAMQSKHREWAHEEVEQRQQAIAAGDLERPPTRGRDRSISPGREPIISDRRVKPSPVQMEVLSSPADVRAAAFHTEHLDHGAMRTRSSSDESVNTLENSLEPDLPRDATSTQTIAAAPTEAGAHAHATKPGTPPKRVKVTPQMTLAPAGRNDAARKDEVAQLVQRQQERIRSQPASPAKPTTPARAAHDAGDVDRFLKFLGPAGPSAAAGYSTVPQMAVADPSPKAAGAGGASASGMQGAVDSLMRAMASEPRPAEGGLVGALTNCVIALYGHVVDRETASAYNTMDATVAALVAAVRESSQANDRLAQQLDAERQLVQQLERRVRILESALTSLPSPPSPQLASPPRADINGPRGPAHAAAVPRSLAPAFSQAQAPTTGAARPAATAIPLSGPPARLGGGGQAVVTAGPRGMDVETPDRRAPQPTPYGYARNGTVGAEAKLGPQANGMKSAPVVVGPDRDLDFDVDESIGSGGSREASPDRPEYTNGATMRAWEP